MSLLRWFVMGGVQAVLLAAFGYVVPDWQFFVLMSPIWGMSFYDYVLQPSKPLTNSRRADRWD